MNTATSQFCKHNNNRKSQDDRSAATKERLLDATYEILRELGHAGLRSANVSERSGVSRGGLLHHYPTKELLTAAAFERITVQMENNSWDRVRTASDDELLSAIVKDARNRFFDTSYKVLLDILVASGKDKALAKVRESLSEQQRPGALDGWTQRLASTGIDTNLARHISSFLWDMVKGLAVRNLVHRDDEFCERVIQLGLDLAHRRYKDATRSD